MPKLFLLKPDFHDANRANGKLYFCPECSPIEGLLSYYPKLREKLEVHYLDYARPRKVLVDLLGEANQSCPVLVPDDGSFINDPADIISYLVEHYQIGHPH
jgi:glutaredoxin 2